MLSRFRSALVLLCLILATVPFALSAAFPQQSSIAVLSSGTGSPEEQPETSTLKVTTRLVVLDVVVTDKQGKPIQRTLGPEDFKVVEDGVSQRMKSFEVPADHRMITADGPVVNSAEDLKKIGQSPVDVVVLDELNTRFEDMAYARSTLIKYLQSQPAVLRQPLLLLAATNMTFQQLHDWTQNRDELIATVKKRMPQYPWRMTNGGQQVERMERVLAALQQTTQALTGTPGRKNLIWVGNGFPGIDLTGLGPEEEDAIKGVIRRITARLLAARITMYTVDPRLTSSATVDLQTPDDLNEFLDMNGGDPFSGDICFTNLAPATGGIAFTGRNDLNHLIQQGIDQGADYYTLSYSPTNKSDDAAKFRRIRIQMKDPNLRATTRDGYFPVVNADLNPVTDTTTKPEQLQHTLELDLSSALSSKISYNGLDVTAEKGSGNDWTIHVKGSGIGWSDPSGGTRHAEATVLAGWYDAKGRLVGHIAREETESRVSGSLMETFTLPVRMPSGVVRLRFIVRDAFNGHIGTFDVTRF
jgi:VWFA-related protein